MRRIRNNLIRGIRKHLSSPALEFLMTFWQWITKSWPLDNERDAMARIGGRFLWCTVPYFALAALMERFGDTTLWNSHRYVLLVAFIPVAGGLIDWRRLQRARTKRQAT